MKTTTQTVCGRCSGTGTYRGAGWTGACYGCDGCGVATAAAGNRAAADLYSAARRACRDGDKVDDLRAFDEFVHGLVACRL